MKDTVLSAYDAEDYKYDINKLIDDISTECDYDVRMEHVKDAQETLDELVHDYKEIYNALEEAEDKLKELVEVVDNLKIYSNKAEDIISKVL